MITSVYKYRSLQGIVEYKILNGQFGIDDTLHLQDTSCKHYGPNCEIEVVKSESGDCYQFSKALNSSAEEYIYFHNGEKFWATERDAYIDAIVKADALCSYGDLMILFDRILLVRDKDKTIGEGPKL